MAERSGKLAPHERFGDDRTNPLRPYFFEGDDSSRVQSYRYIGTGTQEFGGEVLTVDT